MFAIGQSDFLQALGWAVLNSLWQMALLWIVYQIITALHKQAGASQKSILATTLLFTGFGWFLLTFFITLADSAAMHRAYPVLAEIRGGETVKTGLYTALPVASLAYLILLVFPVIQFIRNYRYVNLIRNTNLSKASVDWRLFVRNVAERMGIKKPVQIWLSDLVHTPVTIGYFKPIILLPLAAVNQLSPDQVEAVILHELAHIRRFDFLLNIITRAIQTLMYFNPFVKAFSRIIEKEREKHCDEIVLQFQYEPHGYATALLTLEKAAHSAYRLEVAAADDKKGDLLGRIESIMGIKKKQSFSFTRLAGVMAALLCFISFNLLLIVSKPGDSKLKPGLLTDLTVPFHLFSPESVNGHLDAPRYEMREDLAENTTTIINTPDPVDVAAQGKEITKTDPLGKKEPEMEEALAMEEPALPYTFVNSIEAVIPELAPEEEKQIEKALKASIQVMSEDQWKKVEKNIADVLTLEEKKELKAEYRKAMNKHDLAKVEQHLKLAYDDINWNQINKQLEGALTQIKLDSLQQVYSIALAEMANLERELKEADQPGIPDTDITLKSLEQKKYETQKIINKIKTARQRKIVHL